MGIQLIGRVDHQLAAALIKTLKKEISNRKPIKVTADLNRITYFDDFGVLVLSELRNFLSERSIPFSLIQPPPKPGEVLALSGALLALSVASSSPPPMPTQCCRSACWAPQSRARQPEPGSGSSSGPDSALDSAPSTSSSSQDQANNRATGNPMITRPRANGTVQLGHASVTGSAEAPSRMIHPTAPYNTPT